MKKDFKVKKQYISTVSYTEEEGFLLLIKEDGGQFTVPITLGDPTFFDDCCWTVSYDPKAEAWISFHDWCPELSLPSINHFFTTKTISTDVAQCPPGYNYNPDTELCEKGEAESSLAEVITLEQDAVRITGYCPMDIIFTLDASTAAGDPKDPTSSAYAQIDILVTWLNSGDVYSRAIVGSLQVGILLASEKTNDHDATTFFDSTPLTGTSYSMSRDSPGGGAVIRQWCENNWHSVLDAAGSGAVTIQDMPATLQGAQGLMNIKAINLNPSILGSQLGDRSGASDFKQQIIHLSRLTTLVSTPLACQMQNLIPNQEVFGVGVYENSSVVPTNFQDIINSLTCTSGPYASDIKQFLLPLDNTNPRILDATNVLQTSNSLIDTLCPVQYSFDCDDVNDFTLVWQDAQGFWTKEFPIMPPSSTYVPLCRKVECNCPPSDNPNLPTYTRGTCDDVYESGDPDYVNLDPLFCYYSEQFTTKPSFEVGTLWRHNARCDSFANYYDVAYPWEVDLIENSGQNVNTVRSIEYQLETYVYKGDLHYACGDDRWEDLNFNFDESIIYNNEQVSGLLKLTPTPFNNPILELSYPIINTQNFEILCSKVEQKYRFNQFYDITNDRGEFTNAQQSIFDTECNGYIRNLNSINLNYNKPALQHKKFRHYYNHVLLRRTNSLDRKMLLRLHNTKLLLSKR